MLISLEWMHNENLKTALSTTTLPMLSQNWWTLVY